MESYAITVVCSYHRETDLVPAFPKQKLPAGSIQWLPVLDDNIYNPRENALKKLTEAAGRFTILLDKRDKFKASFLSTLMERLEETDELFAMPATLSRIFRRTAFIR